MKITIPNALRNNSKAITVVYSDSDDGKKQKRMIASSKLSYGKLASLGGAQVVDPKLALCRVKNNILQVVNTQSYDPLQPVW